MKHKEQRTTSKEQSFITYASLITLSFLILSCSSTDKGNISASGTIEATQVTVSSKVAGEITKLFVDEGATLIVGDTLAYINHEASDIDLRQAKANAAATEAQYRLIVKGARQEDLLQADANLQNARNDYSRLEELFKGKSATQKQYDDAQTRLIVAEQIYEKLKRGAQSEEIQAASARRDQAQAAVDAIQKRIHDATILSPCEGVITQKIMEEGENVMMGGGIFRIAQLNKVHLMIYVTEIELAKVKIGQTANVTIDAYANRSFNGKVIFISPNAEFTPKNVQTVDDRTKLVFGVKIEIPNEDFTLKPGMPADASLHQ